VKNGNTARLRAAKAHLIACQRALAFSRQTDGAYLTELTADVGRALDNVWALQCMASVSL
jgi:hypothetical protein